MQGLLETIAPCPFTIFQKKICYETFRGKRNPDFFSRRSQFFPENTIFSPRKSFCENIRNSGFRPCTLYYFSKTRNPVFGHFPSFPASSFMPRVTYLQYLTQCGVKPGLYSVRRSTQTELRKRIYADTRVMAFILLRRYPRIVGVFILGICVIPTA